MAKGTLQLTAKEIEAELKNHIVGQDHVISQILPYITRLRGGFFSGDHPTAVFLFWGPSGTGKTQLAKELAHAVYGSEDSLVILKMEQFNSSESVSQLIGSPPGSVWYGAGKLINGLRDKPESIVLFDEVEKAHQLVLDLLLTLIDRGGISDHDNNIWDARRCIIILTSNVGANTFVQQLSLPSEQYTDLNPALSQAIRNTILLYLKREMINRIDKIAIFRSFSEETYNILVNKQVDLESNRFLDLCGTRVHIMPDVITWLVKRASEAKAEGAWCVPRLVEQFVVSPIHDLLMPDKDRAISKVVLSMKDGRTIAEEA